MLMDRDQFEDGLDRVIIAHGRKVRARIDAAACQTQQDWERAHQTEHAYAEAREAFVEAVFAPPPPPPVPLAVVIGHEDQEPERPGRRPYAWRR